MLYLLLLALARKHRLEEESPQYGKEDEHLQKYQNPQRPTPCHIPEAFSVKSYKWKQFCFSW